MGSTAAATDIEHTVLAQIKARGARAMFDPSAASRVSPELLATLSGNRLAYIKAMRSEEVGFLSPEAPLLAPGYRVFVLHAADGTPILLADSREAALAGAANHEIETVSLH
jgi:hypothetical protein